MRVSIFKTLSCGIVFPFRAYFIKWNSLLVWWCSSEQEIKYQIKTKITSLISLIISAKNIRDLIGYKEVDKSCIFSYFVLSTKYETAFTKRAIMWKIKNKLLCLTRENPLGFQAFRREKMYKMYNMSNTFFVELVLLILLYILFYIIVTKNNIDIICSAQQLIPSLLNWFLIVMDGNLAYKNHWIIITSNYAYFLVSNN